jgi:hypothetical protein
MPAEKYIPGAAADQLQLSDQPETTSKDQPHIIDQPTTTTTEEFQN